MKIEMYYDDLVEIMASAKKMVAKETDGRPTLTRIAFSTEGHKVLARTCDGVYLMHYKARLIESTLEKDDEILIPYTPLKRNRRIEKVVIEADDEQVVIKTNELSFNHFRYKDKFLDTFAILKERSDSDIQMHFNPQRLIDALEPFRKDDSVIIDIFPPMHGFVFNSKDKNKTVFLLPQRPDIV